MRILCDLFRATTRDGDDLALVAAGALAVALVAWHVLGIVCCVLHRVWPQRHTLSRAVALLAPPLARRIVGWTGAATFVLAPATASAVPADPAVVVTTSATSAASGTIDEPFVRAPTAPPAPDAGLPPTSVRHALPSPTPVVPDPRVVPRASQAHVVAPGDNLWRIAEAEVTRVTGRTPSDAELVPYWRAVIATNLATLRSGDPSLIHPGEIVRLPAL